MSVSLGLDGDGLGTCWGRAAGHVDARRRRLRRRARSARSSRTRSTTTTSPASKRSLGSADERAGRRSTDWPVPTVAAAVVGPSGVLASTATPAPFALASVTKPLVARAAQVAIEEGVVDLDTEAGPPGSTVRHLLAHAAGYSMNSPEVDRRAGHAARLLELRLRGARRDDRAGVGHRVRRNTCPRRCSSRSAWPTPSLDGRGGSGGVRGDVDGRRPGGLRRRPAAAGDGVASRCTPRPPTCSFPG